MAEQKDRVKELIEKLKTSDKQTCQKIARDLVEIGGQEVVDALLDLMLKEELSTWYRFRDLLSHILGMLGSKSPKAVDTLIEVLFRNDVNSQAKWVVARALGVAKDKRAVEPLIKILKDNKGGSEYKVEYVKQNIIIALGEIGDQRAIEPLVDILSNTNEHFDIITSAAVSLYRIAGKELLIKKLEENKDNDKIRFSIIRALGETGDSSFVDILIEVLKKDKDYNVRRAAAESLGKIKDIRAVEPLIKTLKKDNKVADVAATALGEIGDRRAVEPLLDVLKSHKYDYTRKMAAIAISKILGVEAIPYLEPYIDDEWIGYAVKPLVEELKQQSNVEVQIIEPQL